jgi:hypothetical protein
MGFMILDEQMFPKEESCSAMDEDPDAQKM